MTRDEVLKMEAGREMDTLVAEKVMGLKRQRMSGTPGHWWAYMDEENHTGKTEDVWKPSEDIAAAWEVVERLTLGKREHPLYCKIVYGWDNLNDCWASFDWKGTGDHHPLYQAQAETAPLAICRSALLAVMEIE